MHCCCPVWFVSKAQLYQKWIICLACQLAKRHFCAFQCVQSEVHTSCMPMCVCSFLFCNLQRSSAGEWEKERARAIFARSLSIAGSAGGTSANCAGCCCCFTRCNLFACAFRFVVSSSCSAVHFNLSASLLRRCVFAFAFIQCTKAAR